MMYGNFLTHVSSAAAILLTLSACGQKSATFSLLSDESQFRQNSSKTNGKIDVLFVVDNSGSMASSQAQLTSNFNRFIQKFNEKGFDYRIAVTTSDAYMDLFGEPETQSQFRDGSDLTQHTGIRVIEPTTPNLSEVFLINAAQGTNGTGDERVFLSMQRTFANPLNSGFPRADAFMSVIILSDEDDFSHDGPESRNNQYSYAGLSTIESIVSYLDGITNATMLTRSQRYNVNSITILDDVCLAALNADIGGRKIGRRYVELSEQTNGIVGSLCGDFATTLSDISSKIIELTTQFYLDRLPVADTVIAYVDGVAVPRLSEASPQPWNGFIYRAETNSVTFHGDSVPGPAANIAVKFDPATLQ